MKAERERIDREAATWAARREAGLSAAAQRGLEAWLSADARHGEALREVERSWARLDALRDTELGEKLERELDESSERARRGVRLMPWLSGALAASVVCALIYLAGWRPARTERSFAGTLTTEVGVVRAVPLPDGSTLRLNTHSAAEVVFTKTERRVRLAHGEAFFTVAKDATRPFVVNAAGVDVRAVGTEFNVRVRAEGVDVVVREGKVRVEDAATGASLLVASEGEVGRARAEAEILAAGHRARVPVVAPPGAGSPAVTRVTVKDEEIARSLAWHEGRLVFEAAPLREIVAEFNRYNRRPIVIEDPELAVRSFGGTFEANDTRTFLELLRTEGIVGEDRGAAGVVLRARR